MRHLILPALLVLSSTRLLTAQETLTSAAAVRALSVEQAELELPVDLTARVAHISYPGTVFIQDAEAGTFFRTSAPVTDLTVGDLVHVSGITFKGLYLTGIQSQDYRVLEHGAPPPAQEATFEDLASGRFHYQLVRIQGVIRHASPLEENQTLLTVALGQQLLEVRLDSPPDLSQDWADTLVEIRGLAAGGINDRRQLVQPHLLVGNQSDIRILATSIPPEQAPEVTAASLLRFQATPDTRRHLRRVRLRGQLLAARQDGQLFLRDLTQDPPAAFAALLSQPATGERLPGETLELVGFPEMSGFSARLRDGQILTSTPGPAPEPIPTRLHDLTSTYLDSDLVTLTASVASQNRTSEGTEWQLVDAGQTLQAFLDGPYPDNLLPGTRVTVTGICQVESSIERGFRAVPASARLYLPSTAAIRVQQAPPWWTPTRLLSLVGLLALIVLGATVWITLLRRRVARQAETLRGRIAKAAMLEERQRIAREFHDTLEQELAGLSIRLGALGSRPLEPKASHLLSNSLNLVSRIQTEARNLVADLRSPDEESLTSLTLALQDLASRQSPEGGPKIHWQLDPHLPALPGPVVHHLRMITQEALTNALKHAQASHIHITTAQQPDHLSLTIQDDGQGFLTDTSAATPPTSHFGQIGIQERARKIQAQVRWDSAPGHGTTVHLTLPLPPSS